MTSYRKFFKNKYVSKPSKLLINGSIFLFYSKTQKNKFLIKCLLKQKE